MKEKMFTKVDYFKWGALNHPGNAMYLIMTIAFALAFFSGKGNNIIILVVAYLLLFLLYFFTSISVGKANERLMREDLTT